MKIIKTKLHDVNIFELDSFSDNRGLFMESYQTNRYKKFGLDYEFVQDNIVFSEKNVLRGLHYQLENPQGNLVQCIIGEIFDIAVDIRKDSPTFGEWVGFILNQNNKRQLFIPPGFAHGYNVLSNECVVIYKCTNYYSKDDEYGIIWNDPLLNIKWKGNSFIISEKDLNYPTIKNAVLPKYGTKNE